MQTIHRSRDLIVWAHVAGISRFKFFNFLPRHSILRLDLNIRSKIRPMTTIAWKAIYGQNQLSLKSCQILQFITLFFYCSPRAIWAAVLIVRYLFFEDFAVQVNLCQKLFFLHQLTHNMTTDCSLNYQFSTWKLQAQNMLCT